eukprot:10734620-Heterocapsa_arctica.AAC.1
MGDREGQHRGHDGDEVPPARSSCSSRQLAGVSGFPSGDHEAQGHAMSGVFPRSSCVPGERVRGSSGHVQERLGGHVEAPRSSWHSHP